jgi:hypothetical protein
VTANDNAKGATMKTASICLYGVRRTGFYCLGDSGGNIFGTMPELGGRWHETATEAIWSLANEMIQSGVPHDARVAIHLDDANGNPRVAVAERLGAIPAFGQLKFSGAGYGVVLSAADIQAAAVRS